MGCVPIFAILVPWINRNSSEKNRSEWTIKTNKIQLAILIKEDFRFFVRFLSV